MGTAAREAAIGRLLSYWMWPEVPQFGDDRPRSGHYGSPKVITAARGAAIGKFYTDECFRCGPAKPRLGSFGSSNAIAAERVANLRCRMRPDGPRFGDFDPPKVLTTVRMDAIEIWGK